ncbi:MAG TPA: tetratricopeptide repeat protein [Pirellulales bacterium]|jgi:tetratricopeptide (TPR) repeat protein|nr:tetratricopeptide repeat protein [Pirellulales bacterium]
MPKRATKKRKRAAAVPSAASPSPTVPARRPTFWPLAIVALLAVCAYAYRQSFVAPMLFDDDYTVRLNPYVRTVGGFWAAAFDQPHSTLSSRPLPALTIALNFYFSHLNVFGYHLVNLAIHLASGAVLWGLVTRTCQAPRVPQRLHPSAPWLATVVTLLWLVHPLQTEAVVYITQRTTLLMGLFLLATLYCTARSWTSARSANLWQSAAVICCAAGMMSKEDMVAVPILVVLYDATFFAPTWRAAMRRHRNLYLCLLGTWPLLAALVYYAPRNETVGISDKINCTPWEYLLTQARAIGRYVRLSFWPDPLILAYDWDQTEQVTEVWRQGVLILFALVVTSVGIILRRWWGWLGACFFLILAPTSSILPIATEFIAERRMYLPLLAIIVPIVVAGELLRQRIVRHVPDMRLAADGITALVVLAVSLAMVRGTVARVADYRSEVSIWSDTVAKAPNRAVSQNNLGRAYSEIGDIANALAHYHKSVELSPGSSEGHTNLALMYQRLGKIDLAVEHGRLAVQAAPDKPLLHVNLAMVLMDANKPAGAAAEVEAALRLAPNLCETNNVKGILLARQRRYADAEPCFRRAIELDPSDPRPHYNLGQMLIDEHSGADGSIDAAALAKAIEQFRAGLAVRPSDPDGHSRLAGAYIRQGNLSAALAEFEIVARLLPGDANVRQQIAQLRAAMQKQ